MTSISVLVVFILVLGSVTCMPHNARDLQRNFDGRVHAKLGMYGGIPTTIQRHPFMAAIQSDNYFFCAGAIIGDKWVISSAVCMYSLKVESLTVVAASNDAYTGDVYKVEEKIIHPKYNLDTTDYPYALVKISGTFTWKSKVKAIKLPTEGLVGTVKILVSGWDGTDKLSLLQGGMKWMPKDFCNSTFSQVDYTWTDRLACAYNKGKTTLCGNDYGDPIVYKGVLYGIFVWTYPGNFCSPNAGPILLANVYQAVEWIKETMGK